MDLASKTPSKPHIHLLFFDAGGGHRAASTALRQILEQQHPDWHIHQVDLQDVLDEIDIFRKVTGLRLEELYNQVLAKGWTLGSAQILPLMQLVIRLLHGTQVKVLERYWRANRPDLVVSLIPNLNRACFQALQRVDPQIPYTTILTDLADYPPHFWIERQRQSFICGTARAAQQVQEYGHPEATVHLVSGMILNPKFYNLAPIDRAEARRALGLDPQLPTALVLFGGEGSPKMRKIVEQLEASPLQLQFLLLCGKNLRLAEELRNLPGRLRRHVEGFTTNVPHFMQLADFFIGKPGPGSVSEAIHLGLPVIVEQNAWTLPQERFNAEWVVQQGVGERLTSFSQIVPAVERLLQPGELARRQAKARSLENRALFEVAEILHKMRECSAT